MQNILTKQKTKKSVKNECIVSQSQIDQLGYRLYGLIQEEIAMIENSVK